MLSILEQGPRYAYQLRDEMHQRFDSEVGEVTAYVVLYALRREGCVAISRIEPRKQGLAREYYQITAQGRAALSKGISCFADLSERLKREKERTRV